MAELGMTMDLLILLISIGVFTVSTAVIVKKMRGKRSAILPDSQPYPSNPIQSSSQPQREPFTRPAFHAAGHIQRSGIFISYRRQDEPNFAGRLYDRLAEHFGRDNVFIDVDSIELGLDFVDVINRSLSQCKVVIVVIGKNWLTSADTQGRPRLEDPNDYVRLEIEIALNRNIRVIPVLVEGASTPRGDELPNSIAALARRNGREISHARFATEADDLVNTLKRIVNTADTT